MTHTEHRLGGSHDCQRCVEAHAVARAAQAEWAVVQGDHEMGTPEYVEGMIDHHLAIAAYIAARREHHSLMS